MAGRQVSNFIMTADGSKLSVEEELQRGGVEEAGNKEELILE